jgi:hypothetical protein
MAVTAKNPTTGDDIELSELTCTACSGPMDGHRCPGASFTVTTGPAPRSGAGQARGKPQDKPKCDQCGSPIHYNMGRGLENVLCAYIQWAVSTGKISDPVNDLRKLSALIPGDGTLTEVDDFAQAHGLKFGKEAVASGITTSYAGIRAKEVAEKRAAEGPKVRKPKKDLSAVVAQATEAPTEEPVIQAPASEEYSTEPFVPSDESVTEAPVENGEASTDSTTGAKAAARSARRADLQRQRKEKMKALKIVR